MMKKQFCKRTKQLLVALAINLAGLQGQEVKIIPNPNSMEMQQGVFNLSGGTRIYYDKNCKKEASYLKQLLFDEHQFNIQIVENIPARKSAGNIYLAILTGADAGSLGKEAYHLAVHQNNISVTGGSTAGVFYGIQSLRQIIKSGIDQGLVVPCVIVKDKPRFGWRAFMLDEGRFFKGENVVKELLDGMALLKMNTFHWHLTDDGGWRIEIKKYPLLTKVGSKRRMSELGSWGSNVFDSIPHSGFYTQEQVKRIIRYAADRHIVIIPEIEMPGHASAAIASYPWLGVENKKIEVPITFGIKQDVFNVANSRVQEFLRDILDEIMQLFPSQIVHIGGDEVKYEQWKTSTEVRAYMKSNGIRTPADLQIKFTNGLSNYFEKNGHRMIGWNDILGGLHSNNDSVDASAKEKLSEKTIIQFWTGDPEIVTKTALKGHDIVNSYSLHTYLDYDYKITPTETVYNFSPVPASLPENMHHRILGIGAQMWGEWIPTVKDMNYKLYPRIAAAAEVAWTNSERKNYKLFKTGLNNYVIPYWKKKGITINSKQLDTSEK